MSSLCNIFFCIYNFQFSDKLSFSLTHPRDTMRTSPALARVPPSHRPTRKARDVYQRWKKTALGAVSQNSQSIASFLLSLDTFVHECRALEEQAVENRSYANAEKFRRAWMHTGAVKKEITSEMEREVVNSSRRNHLEAARARKRIEELTGEFSLFQEKVLSDDEDGTILMFRDRNTNSDDTLSSFPSSSSASASSSSIIQTNFFIRKDDCEEYGRRVRLAGSCIELGEWDVKRSVELQKVDDNDNLYTCSIDMSVKSIDDFKFKFFTCTENIKDIDWQTCEDGNFRNAIDGSGETIALNFTVDWMGNNMEERVWVCRSLER